MILVIALAVFVGAFVQAVVGLGVGLVTAPLVAVLEPSLMPALPLWFGLFVSGLSLAGERHHIDWRAITWTLPARAVGTLPGVWLVLAFTPARIGIAVSMPARQGVVRLRCSVLAHGVLLQSRLITALLTDEPRRRARAWPERTT